MFIVDRHHKVLTAWAEYRRRVPSAPRLLTLDHHTDTSAPFRNRLKLTGADLSVQAKWLEEVNFESAPSVEAAVERLNNDEHVITAIKTNIISSALVVAHNARDTDLATYLEHKVVCRSVDRETTSKTVDRSICDTVLESEFLKERIDGLNSVLREAGEPLLLDAPYILDIDLDYFNTIRSLSPRDSSFIRLLARQAGLITIATEPDYVVACALDTGLSSELALGALVEYLSGLN